MNYKLSELFKKCAWDIHYTNVNDWVSYAFVEENSDLYIYFQGSCEVKDWLANFLFKRKPYKDMETPYKVHRGFLQAWKEVEDIIIAKICEDDENGSYKWKHITVVGYSHGGALAAFCHECVWYWRPDLREKGLVGYGFEAPRIFGQWRLSEKLAERWNNFTVIRTNNDLVTHCPPAIFRYRHVGSIMTIEGDVSLVESKWIPDCIKSHYPQVVYDALTKLEESIIFSK